MPGALPERIAHTLVDPHAWISTGTVQDVDDSRPTARTFLSTLWTLLADTLPTDFPSDTLRLAVVRSLGISVRVHGAPDGTHTITISQGTLRAYDVYARGWTAHHHPELAALTPGQTGVPGIDPGRLARGAVLDMAVDFRNTGMVRPRPLALTPEGVGLVGAHMAVGLVFLLAHEVAHVTSGHLAPDDTGPTATGGPASCLDLDPHAREFEADRVAAQFMSLNPPAVTAVGSSLRILFEMLQLLAVGVPTATLTHPHPVERMLAVLEAVDVGERDSVVDDLVHRRQTWLGTPS